jgi:hypothetical protein
VIYLQLSAFQREVIAIGWEKIGFNLHPKGGDKKVEGKNEGFRCNYEIRKMEICWH